MADDIDDLLDEVENKFVKGNQVEKKTVKSKPTRRKQEDEEMDKIIDDICGPNEPIFEKCNSVKTVPTQTSQSRPLVTKCFPLSVGGSSVAKGHGNSVNKRFAFMKQQFYKFNDIDTPYIFRSSEHKVAQRSCDSIRCTSCDFIVASFDDFEWDMSTDYLFLRNNAPDFHRLKSKLSQRKGYRAYCCQCSHVAVNILTAVKDLQLKWVCGQH